MREDYNEWVLQHAEDLDRAMPVSELFGPTIQGEGPYAGRCAWFVRFGGCNLSCSWCDTPYSTGTHGIPLSTVPRRTVRSMLQALPPQSVVVLTGGEPLMQSKSPAFRMLLHGLKARGCEVHIETNGTYLPTADIAQHIDHFTVSPKTNVTMVRKRDENVAVADWGAYADKVIMKFVIDSDDVTGQVQQYIAYAKDHGIDHQHVWFMPEGISTEQLQHRFRRVADAAARTGTNVSHRLHVLAWGNERGR